MKGDRHELLTFADVARRAGWCCEDAKKKPVGSPRCNCRLCDKGEQRMRRHLLAQDKQLNGMLLERRGEGTRTRYLVSLAAIEQVAPQWFADPEGDKGRIDKLERDRASFWVLLERAHRDIGDLRRRLERFEAIAKEAGVDLT